jgi:hypothetical protein
MLQPPDAPLLLCWVARAKQDGASTAQLGRLSKLENRTTMQRWTLIDDTSSRRPFAAAVPPSEDEPSALPEVIEVQGGRFRIDWSSWGDGKACGMKCLSIDTGRTVATLLPSRGMGLWKCWAGPHELGWQSPVRGPVHPALVPIGDPSGIGWLEGFDELLVRCGLLSNGAPELDASGVVRYPVHGRIANLPAHALRIEVHPELGVMDVIGKVAEARFLIYSLELESRIRFYADRNWIEITDTVTNTLTTPGSMQLLYHINLGQPMLQSGSRIVAALESVAPRDARAAEGSDDWNACQGPESGYSEQVYFAKPYADEQYWSEAMLTNSDGSLGYSVHFDTRTLPYVNFWKNTAAVEDGYVLGIEPSTGFPNTRSFEEHHGRLVRLQGGESRVFRLRLQPHGTRAEVEQAERRIQQLQSKPCCVETHPKLGWSASAGPAV